MNTLSKIVSDSWANLTIYVRFPDNIRTSDGHPLEIPYVINGYPLDVQLCAVDVLGISYGYPEETILDIHTYFKWISNGCRVDIQNRTSSG